MILNDNIALVPGDVIVFQTVPMLNIQTVNTYADSVIGETASRFFQRDFQYSLDGGVTWSVWYNLNNNNITNITQINLLLQSNFHQLVIQFKFTRVGTDSTGQLQINSISINGTNVDRGSVFNVGAKSILQNTIFNDINVLNLMVNLAQKMYEFGIVPAYLTRQEEDAGFMSDEVYVDFWQTIAYFYAVIAVDSIKFENVYWRRPLLFEFLREHNIFLCNGNDVIQMQLIAQNFLTEIRVRGTEEVFKPKGYQYAAGYRNTYNLPTSYTIQPSTGVQIDGIIYGEVSVLPFGWVLSGATLLAPDRNYHQIFFWNGITSTYSIPPTGKSVIFPTTNSGILKKYDGEYLRLICYNANCDEFIYNNIADIYQGWCLSNASPCYQGLRPQRNKSLLKAYELQASVLDLTKYPLINPGQIYIGVTNNPSGVQDTVMYISSDGTPCFPNVPILQINVSSHLTINANSYNAIASGVVRLTNLTTLNTFDTAITLGLGQNTYTIDTDLQPAQYSVELIFTHTGTMVSEITDSAGIDLFNTDITGTVDILYSLNNVGTTLIFINLNFNSKPTNLLTETGAPILTEGGQNIIL